MLRSREHGGKLLARELEPLRADEPIVLGIARGGAPVAVEIARALDAPFDVMAAVRIGAPECPEHTVAAVAEGGGVFLRRDAFREVDLTEPELTELVLDAEVELHRRIRGYRGDGAPVPIAGRTVLLVDDGVATGATACAAARAARRRGAARVIFAAPVVAAAAAPVVALEVEELVTLERPRPLLALGLWYERFGPVSDEAVVRCLQLAGRPIPRCEAERVWGGEPPAAGSADAPAHAESVHAIPLEDGPGCLDADLVLPSGAESVVVFGTGSIRGSPRYRIVSRALHRAGVGTLRCDLFTPAEREGAPTGVPATPGLLRRRIATALRWLATHPATRGLSRGVYCAGAGAGAALAAVAAEPELADAVVVRAGELDNVPAAVLESVRAPVLLVVGSRDENVLAENRAALAHLATVDLAIVPGVTDLFAEPGALEAVGRLSAVWFRRWLGRAADAARAAPRAYGAGV